MTMMLWIILVWNPGPTLDPLPIPSPKSDDCIMVPLEKAHQSGKVDPVLEA